MRLTSRGGAQLQRTANAEDENAQQDGCRHLREGYLSCQKRLALAVARSEVFDQKMRKARKAILFLSALSAIAVVLLLGYKNWRFRTFQLVSASPDESIEVRGLRFKGVKKHPLDGCLRILVSSQETMLEDGIQQTSILWNTDLSFEWRDRDTTAFSIVRDNDILITWEIQGDRVVCTKGQNLITYDPHELWRRTGNSRPVPKTEQGGSRDLAPPHLVLLRSGFDYAKILLETVTGFDPRSSVSFDVRPTQRVNHLSTDSEL